MKPGPTNRQIKKNYNHFFSIQFSMFSISPRFNNIKVSSASDTFSILVYWYAVSNRVNINFSCYYYKTYNATYIDSMHNACNSILLK